MNQCLRFPQTVYHIFAQDVCQITLPDKWLHNTILGSVLGRRQRLCLDGRMLLLLKTWHNCSFFWLEILVEPALENV